MNDTDLAWLAGIIDGEGSISVYGSLRNDGSYFLVPRMTISNTNKKIIDKAISIMSNIDSDGFGYYYQEANNYRKARIYRLYIANRIYLEKIMEAVLPYLIGKKEHAITMLAYLKSRNRGYKKYTKEELSYPDKFKELNKPAETFEKIENNWSKFNAGILK